MNRNASARGVLEDQIDGILMESRIARIESDVSQLKEDVAAIKEDSRSGFKHCNESIASLREGQAELRGEIKALRHEVTGEIKALRHEVTAKIHGLELKVVKWIVGTAVGCASVAFSIAKFIH